jgi:hypothetical protein
MFHGFRVSKFKTLRLDQFRSFSGHPERGVPSAQDDHTMWLRLKIPCEIY